MTPKGEVVGKVVLNITMSALQVALALIAFHNDFGDIEGWDEGFRSMLGMLASAS
jgi:hypothetical protein